MSDLKKVIDESFSQYSAAVIQSRALVDSRDFLKPSARQIFYSMLLNKLVHKNPYKKTANAVGLSMADFYIHGDSSCEGIIMRAGQDFAMRYPLVEVKGNAGSLIESGNWAASRYTESRLAELSNYLFADIDKNVIEEWRDSYDNTKQYPGVLSSKGFYNIVNGTSGIATGIASSIPQFNIKDVNKALETLLLNPETTFEELYCQPDFATGAYLINEEEVKNALKYGSKALAIYNGNDGAACKLRAKIDYEQKENCLIVTEIPYGVYTNTICGQLEALIENDEINPGIDRFNDLTGSTPNIKIYLKKGANIQRAIKSLYKNTSLQYHYSINMTMLDKGRFPKVFTWKEALQSHIDHELEVYKRGYEFDLSKIKHRIHIIDGLLICMASIEEVIQTIKTSSSTADASKNLQSKYLLDEEQSKAVLDMKLSRLAHLEVQKLENEKVDLTKQAEKIEAILNDRNLLNQELIKTWHEISNKYGDEHRTKVIKVTDDSSEEKEIADVVAEDCVVMLSQSGNIKRVMSKNFKVQKRNGKGVKNKDEIMIATINTNTIDNLLAFTDKGKMYRLLVDDLPEGTSAPIASYIGLEDNENVIAITSLERYNRKKYVVFITKNGMIKKTELEEYIKTKRSSGIAAIKLGEDDTIANVIFLNDEDLVLITKCGMSIHFDTTSINAIGRNTAGVKSIKLNEDDYVLTGIPVNRNSEIAIVNELGIGKKLKIDEFPLQGRCGKGVIVSKENIAAAAVVTDEDNFLIIGYSNSICISGKEFPSLGRSASGNIMIKDKVRNMVKI